MLLEQFFIILARESSSGSTVKRYKPAKVFVSAKAQRFLDLEGQKRNIALSLTW